MLDFEYFTPTKIIFSRDGLKRLIPEIKKYGSRVLFVYGRNSIKQTGLYSEVIDLFRQDSIVFEELSGVEPNPKLKKVKEGIELFRSGKLDFILAAGGGSVIDCSKAIAAGVWYEGDPWDFFIRKAEITKTVPLGVILTLSATGSEMNGFSVITNEKTNDKLSAGSDLLKPKFSILNPAFTFSVSPKDTAAGLADIFSHVIEQYFSNDRAAFIQDRLAEAVLKTCIHYAEAVLDEPKNYEARANIMWASSLALNGLLGAGKTSDWAVHYIEHSLSAVYDITHGVGLAILIPYWMEYVLDDSNLVKFCEYARNVWGVTDGTPKEQALESIEKTKEFFKKLGMPSHLKDVGIEESRLKELAEKSVIFGDIGNFRKLSKNDVMNILKEAF